MSEHTMTASQAISAMPATLPADVKTAFEALYEKLIADWAAVKAKLSSVPWFKVNPSTIAAAWQYVANAILQLTGLVDAQGIPNPDKKAAVLAYATKLYEGIVLPEIPTLLRPIAAALEPTIIGFLSGAIENAVALWHKVPIPQPPIPLPTPSPVPVGSRAMFYQAS